MLDRSSRFAARLILGASIALVADDATAWFPGDHVGPSTGLEALPSNGASLRYRDPRGAIVGGVPVAVTLEVIGDVVDRVRLEAAPVPTGDAPTSAECVAPRPADYALVDTLRLDERRGFVTMTDRLCAVAELGADACTGFALADGEVTTSVSLLRGAAGQWAVVEHRRDPRLMPLDWAEEGSRAARERIEAAVDATATWSGASRALGPLRAAATAPEGREALLAAAKRAVSRQSTASCRHEVALDAYMLFMRQALHRLRQGVGGGDAPWPARTEASFQALEARYEAVRVEAVEAMTELQRFVETWSR